VLVSELAYARGTDEAAAVDWLESLLEESQVG
jgi:hypothetical protein